MRVMTRLVVGVALVAMGLGSMAAQTPQAPPQPGQPPAGRAGGRGNPPLLMTTTAFEDGGVIPVRFSMTATPSTSPEFKWSQVPPGTQSFMLIFHDLENIVGRGSKMDATHWLVWNIPATATSLPEGMPAGDLPDGTRQVGFRGPGYTGPGAPPGPHHHYVFELYALDIKLDIPAGNANAVRAAVNEAAEGHVLGKAVLVGRYRRE
jgi:Raf kinase inhibitor-like YbhB/YbcL family protein